MSGPEAFRAAPFHAIRAREGKHAVTRVGSAQTHVIPEASFRVLEGMRAFLPLEGHERVAAERLGGNATGVRAALDDLRNRGLLIAASEFLATAPPSEQPEIRSIGAPTRGGATLERCVSSYAAHARERGRSARFLLAGKVPPDRAGAMARDCDMPVEVLDASARERTIRRLAAAGVDEAAARFALLGEAEGIPEGWARNTGANRNALLLATAGEPTLSVDDDTFATLFLPPAASQPSRGAFERGGQLEAWFDTGEPFPCEPAADADLLGLAAAALGPAMRPGSALAGVEIPHATFERLLAGQARVLVAQLGLCGDAGAITPAGRLTLSGPARDRLVATESGYRQAMKSRRTFHVAPGVTLTDAEALMSYCVALDGRALLPPFPPLGRDQDGAFSVWLRACDPASFTAHVPLAVAHEPETAREFGPEALTGGAIGLTLNDSLRLAVGAVAGAAPPLSPELRMGWLGARLDEIGRWPETDYRRLLRERRLGALAGLIERFERVLAQHGSQPAWWARDLQGLVRACENKMEGPDLLAVREPGAGALTDPARVCQRYLRWCGQLLEAWPEIFRAAQAEAHQR